MQIQFDAYITQRLFARSFQEIFLLLEHYEVDQEEVIKIMQKKLWKDFVWNIDLFRIIDEIGFSKINKALSSKSPPLLKRLIDHNWERGFYPHNDSGNHSGVQEVLKVWYPERKNMDAKEFAERIVSVFLVEALLMVSDGIDRYEIDKTMAALSFPCGGPLHTIDYITPQVLMNNMINWYGKKDPDPKKRDMIMIAPEYCPSLLQRYGHPSSGPIFGM